MLPPADQMARLNDNALAHAIIGASIQVHRALGPGLLEGVYEECLACEMKARGIPFERQKAIPLVYRDIKLEAGYRLDFLIAERIVLEIKAIAAIAPVHDTIMLTYLRLSGCRLGFLINFNVPVLKDGIRRFVWNYVPDVEEQERTNAEARSTRRNAENLPEKT